jgi:23S rRNA pseudouridine2457 synthase
MKYILFYKPYNVICQFTSEPHVTNLSSFQLPPDVYAAGRLDKDSEGLLFLTNDGPLIHRLTDPKFEKPKTYWVQVENIPTEEKLNQLRQGVKIQDYFTLPCEIKIIAEPKIAPRNPPIRVRKNIPTCWLEMTLIEGKNRQIRHMTAYIGHPTLRLIRFSLGNWDLGNLTPGQWQEIHKL